ncbi:MAG TPA: hypothetical protein VFX16_21130 [Pseudonocardiaceae bacterium]|nr:hypothetical protein [Pseudonocardiaceae bacterium]
MSLSVQDRQLRELARHLKTFEDGKVLRRNLAKKLRTAVKPVVVQVKAAIRSMPSKGRGSGPSMRAAIAKRVAAQARPTTGRTAGVKIVARKPKLRGFANAPQRFNRRSFRHPTFGDTDVWVTQAGRLGWFDDVIARNRPRFRREVKGVLDEFKRELDR